MNKTKLTKKRIVALAIGGIAILTVIVGIFSLNSYFVQLKLNGESEVVLEYGEPYREAGAKAYFRSSLFGEATEIEVTTEGEVDAGKLGTYEITYKAKKSFFSATKKRKVTVVDTTAPVLSLNTVDGNYTLEGEPYEEEGFTALDNYDGDLTAQVERKEEDGVVHYTVTDSSGNKAEAVRNILYKDAVPPVLTLAGDTTISIKAGEKFEEPGWTAIDEVDGDLSEHVQISGSVDTFRAGTYTLTYLVMDQFGNEATATRTVEVRPIQQSGTVDPGTKVIYLTFDDGPGPYTQELLDVLDKYNVKVTFFTTSANAKYLDLLTKEAEAGHTVAIHTSCHDYNIIYASEEAYFSDLKAQSDMIEQKTGKKSMLLRFPGGSSNMVSRFNPGIMTKLSQAVEDQGYKYFDWNVSSGDAGGAEGVKTPDGVYENVINGVKNKQVSIVLQHDIKEFSVRAVEKIIIWGLDNGYTFLPLDETSPEIHHKIAN